MLDEFKAKHGKLGKKNGSWTKLPQLLVGPIGEATGQWLMFNAQQEEVDGRPVPEGAKPDKGWVFSVKLEDSLLQRYQPKRTDHGQEMTGKLGAAGKRELFPVLIFGTDEFVEKTEDALALIKEKSPRSYELVTNYVSIIKLAEKSGMRAYNNPPMYEVGERTARSNLSWYASTIVHDANHSKQYNDYRRKFNRNVPSEVWTGRKAENECLDAQEAFMRDINAPESRIKHLQKMREVDYFSDYKNRNW